MRPGSTVNRASPGGVIALVLLTMMIASVVSRCDAGRRRDAQSARDEPAREAPYQAEVEESIGAAVAILVDTSGSMKEPAPGDSRPKYVVAQEALGAHVYERFLEAKTMEWDQYRMYVSPWEIDRYLEEF